MAELVEIKKGSKKKSITKAQWDAMVSSKSTYGWTLASDLPAEVLKKDKNIQASVVDKLKDENKDLKTEIAGLKATIGDKDLKIEELEAELKAYMHSNDIKAENLKAATGSSDAKPEEPAVTENIKAEAKAPVKTDASDVKANTSKGGKKDSGK